MNQIKYDEYKKMVNEALDECVTCRVPELREAMRYSALADGKRVRPVLMLATCEAVGGDIKDAMPYACAIEMIHCYSLVHDDLPCMDDDEYRRGKKTNHVVFGEALAMLAGDGLLNMAYEIMAKSCMKEHDKKMANRYLNALNVIAASAGADGMVGGQTVDISFENKSISVDELLYMYEHKTAGLIRAAVTAGAVIGGAGSEKVLMLEDAAKKLGIAFQIKDDLLDANGDFEKLGKTTSDERNKKSTYVAIFGIEKSAAECARLQHEAAALLGRAGVSGGFLSELVDWLAGRDA